MVTAHKIDDPFLGACFRGPAHTTKQTMDDFGLIHLQQFFIEQHSIKLHLASEKKIWNAEIVCH